MRKALVNATNLLEIREEGIRERGRGKEHFVKKGKPVPGAMESAGDLKKRERRILRKKGETGHVCNSQEDRKGGRKSPQRRGNRKGGLGAFRSD